jgi:hypothetical protein
MNQLERQNDFEESLRVAMRGMAVSMWGAMPGIVESYDPVQGTCRIQPTIKGRVGSTAGTYSFVNLPLLVDVPVIYMGGGAFVATFPIQPGDEALVVFADRCIDSWWQNGGVQAPADSRMHDLSDGFALIGPRSLARSIPNVSATTAQLRTMDGTTYYELAAGGVANIVAPGGVNITGPVNITGAVSVTGAITSSGAVTATGEGTFKEIPVSTHIHTGVTSGGSNTGEPIA